MPRFPIALLTALLLAPAVGCDPKAAGPSGITLRVGEDVLLPKDAVYVVEGTNITVINRGRGMTIESEGGHEIFATLDVANEGTKTKLDLHGWDAKEFAGYSFAITGIGEKHGGTDVEIRVTKL